MPDLPNQYRKIVAVVVTYNPQIDALARLIENVQPQVDHLLIVDNNSAGELSDWAAHKKDRQFHWLPLAQNIGLAAALNLGIAQARKLEADYILLLDQDSLPAENMVSRLLNAAEKISATGYPPAAVGPRYTDSHREARPFTRLSGLRIRNLTCSGSEEIIAVDHLITSGSLIPVVVLDTVGDFFEGLFIDFIDIEWCLRARTAGHISYGVCSAQMQHNLGEHPVRFLGRSYCMHSAVRHYYQIRNAVWMSKRIWLPWGWRVTIFRQMLLKCLFYSIFSRPRIEHFRLMSLGLWHGLIGQMGKLKIPH